MTTLLHAPSRVHSKFADAPCPAIAATDGFDCRAAWMFDESRWCPSCRRAEAAYRVALASPTAPEPDAPAEPRLPMADWIEVEGQALRLRGSNLADWLAARLDDLAAECRSLHAGTPDEFDARSEVMAGGPALDERRYLDDGDSYPYGRNG